MRRSACRALAWGLPAILLWPAAAAGQAAPTVTLRVRSLRAAGGEGGVERDLPTRLTTALTRFLRDHADPTLRIETTQRLEQSAQRNPIAHYALEGDLSYAAGANPENGRYLLVARLMRVREGRPSGLIGQWAGSANSLRYLTANLRNDPRVHPLGLIGEIGSRVLSAVAADVASPDQQWRGLSARLTPLRAPEATAIQAEAPNAVRPWIATGDAFRLRLQTTRETRAYLLTSGPEGTFVLSPLTLTQKEAATPHKFQADSQVLHLPEGTREAWLLCRITAPHQGISTQICPSTTDEDDSPVQVLNGVGKDVHVSQEALMPLLQEIAHDAKGWRVLRLHVTTLHK